MVVQLHGEADDIVPLAGEQGSGDRGVHAARHGYHYTHTFIAQCQRRTKRASSQEPLILAGYRRAPVRDRSFSTAFGSFSSRKSISASVLPAPRLNRIEFWARCVGRPIARSTCEGS